MAAELRLEARVASLAPQEIGRGGRRGSTAGVQSTLLAYLPRLRQENRQAAIEPFRTYTQQ